MLKANKITINRSTGFLQHQNLIKERVLFCLIHFLRKTVCTSLIFLSSLNHVCLLIWFEVVEPGIVHLFFIYVPYSFFPFSFLTLYFT